MHAYFGYKLKIISWILLLSLFSVSCSGTSNTQELSEEDIALLLESELPLVAEEVQIWPEKSNRLREGRTVNSELGRSGGLLLDNTPIDLYEFEGELGQFVTLSLESTEFDAYLVLVDKLGRIIGTNDDSLPKDGTDAQISMYLPNEGTFQLFVNSNQGGEGDYSLELAVEDRIEMNTLLPLDEPITGWLKVGDELNESGLYVDYWEFEMPDNPVVVWMRSIEFDTLLTAISAEGDVIERNDDENFVGRIGTSRIYLEPSDILTPGSIIRLEASMPSEQATGGVYELFATEYPDTLTPSANVTLRPVVVLHESIRLDQTKLEQDWQDLVTYTQSIWQDCNISISVLDDELHFVEIEGFPDDMRITEGDWTPDEELLQQHPLHSLPSEGVVTVFVVPQIDEGVRYGASYPSTRYGPGRSGMLIIAQNTLTDPAHFVTLAHEIGHILGISHPETINEDGDGDALNDSAENVMTTLIHAGDEVDFLPTLSPLQCITARAAHHYLKTEQDLAIVPPAFERVERVLQSGQSVVESLTTQDNIVQDEFFIDVFYVRGNAGQELEINVQSTDFDPFVVLQLADGTTLQENDDGGLGNNAKLKFDLEQDNDYLIGISSYLPFERGEYELSVSLSE